MDEKQFPTHFLGDTEEEATKVFKKYEKLLLKISRDYSKNTGLDVNDLFGEALFGLARALRDFDKSRSANINPVINRYVLNALNDFVRKNTNVTNIPNYIKLTIDNIRKINKIFEKYGYDENSVLSALLIGKIEIEMNENDITKCLSAVSSIQNAANRAGISFSELIHRANINLFCEEETSDSLDTKLIVQKIKDFLNDEELIIIEKMLEGKTQMEIAKEIDRSKTWLVNKLKSIKNKLESNGICYL